MPAYIIPRKVGAHRVAAIALYRALLTQCAAVPLPAEQRILLSHIARNKFRLNAHEQSARLLKLAFTTGYETLHLLDRSAAGNANSTSQILSLLAQTPQHLLQDPVATAAARKQQRDAKRPDRVPEAALPEGQKFIETRPYAQVGGVRHVPKLVVANRWPFLRVKKPQPRSLSRVITDKTKQRQAWMDARNDMMELINGAAKAEDDWDDLVQVMHGVGDTEDSQAAFISQSSWLDAPYETLRGISRKLDMQREQVVERSAKLQEIIDKETELAATEKRMRKMKKKEERKARKAEERRASEDSSP